MALGESAPAAFPVEVSIEGHGPLLQITVDGQSHAVASALGLGWRGVSFEQPGPLEREYQVDGSDTTSSNDRDPAFIATMLNSPLYAIDSWLRDESSYSRWERVRIVDLATGHLIPGESVLPNDFRVEAALRRPEATARLWLTDATSDRREGLELNRDTRNARWMVQRGGSTDYLPRWFFPEQAAPFAAELLHLAGRTTAAAFALALAVLLLSRALALVPRVLLSARPPARPPFDTAKRNDEASRGPSHADENASRERHRDVTKYKKASRERHRDVTKRDSSKIPFFSSFANVGITRWPDDLGGIFSSRVLAELLLATWLVAAALVTASVYRQLPHLLDAVSYTFQAGLLASGKLALDAPPFAAAFKGPFEVLWQGRLFSQYPPGAAAVYALGQLVGLEWLVGPLACLVLIGATSWTAGALYGRPTGLVVLALGVLSPFVLFQAGSFLSHPIAGGLLAGALAAFVAAERDGRRRWSAVAGVLLGISFLTREASSVLFALPLALRLLARQRWRPAITMLACGAPSVLAYLLYNQWLTGSPWLLPRTIFDASDHFGFGDGIGFHTRHTLAAGLANTDELLTLLQFDLFGWPPLLALGLLVVPFLLGRARTWDGLAAFGFLGFVVAYAGYFYHGIALGPRYYFEAMPWLLLLAGRGAQVLATLAHSRVAVGLVLAVLSLNTVFLYVPAEVQRRTDFSGMVGTRRLSLDFVQTSLLGPRLVGLPDRALILTNDWWLYNAALAPFNCPKLPDCPVLFALASTPDDQSRLRDDYPDRSVLLAVDIGGHIRLAPVS